MSLTQIAMNRLPTGAWATQPVISADGLTITQNDAITATWIVNKGKKSGKWYWEVTADAIGNTATFFTGVTTWETASMNLATPTATECYYIGVSPVAGSCSYGYPAVVNSNMPSTLISGGTVGLFMDYPDGLSYKINNYRLFDTPLNTTLNVNCPNGAFPFIGINAVKGGVYTFNFGAKPFKYDPPKGYAPYDNPGFVYRVDNGDIYIYDGAGWVKVGNGEVTQTHINAATASPWCIANTPKIIDLVKASGTLHIELFTGLSPITKSYTKDFVASSSYSSYMVDFAEWQTNTRMEVI